VKRFLLAIAVAGTISAPAGAADIGVSLSIGEPGFYGQIDIGGFSQPQLLYAQPVMIERAPPGRPPIYLRVPPGQAKRWARYCGQYNACGERVYFVRDDWYEHEYAPRYQERHAPPPERHQNRDDRRDDHRDDRRDGRPDDYRGDRSHDNRGPNNGHGGDRD
jgi:hypothetical protein